jgi:flagellar biosynthetic protein FliR
MIPAGCTATAEQDPLFGLLVIALLLGRIAPIIWITPSFGGRTLSQPLRIGLALMLATVLAPQLIPSAVKLAASGTTHAMAVVVKETLVGFAIGFVLALVFWAIQAGGWLIDSVRGATASEVTVPQSGERSSALGNLLFQLTLVVFFAAGGHRLVLEALHHAYGSLPLDAVPRTTGIGEFAQLCLRLSADLFVVALGIAAPIIAATLIAEVILGWVNRFAPQVNVFFMAMPIKSMVAIGILALILTLFLGFLPRTLELGVEQMRAAIEMLTR